jgi:hypothetical protein
MANADDDDDDVGVEPQSKEQQQLNAMGADREEKELDTSKFVGAIGSVEEEHKSAQAAKAQRCVTKMCCGPHAALWFLMF